MLGEPLLICVSLALVAVAMIPMPFVRTWAELLSTLALLSIGSSLTRPPVFGMISMLTPATDQGGVLGVAQSAGSLARIVGPIFAATLFTHHPALPYVIAGSLALMAALLAWQFLHRRTEAAAPAPSAALPGA
jgi:sugar phosphate permease